MVETPPIEPGPLISGRPPTVWPTVFGVISIVLAVGGILTHGCNIVYSIFAAIAETVGESAKTGMPTGVLGPSRTPAAPTSPSTCPRSGGSRRAWPM